MLGDKPVSVPRRPPPIPRGLYGNQNRASEIRGQWNGLELREMIYIYRTEFLAHGKQSQHYSDLPGDPAQGYDRFIVRVTGNI